MSEDVPYLYYPNTDMFYLTGVVEPGCVLMACKQNNETVYGLFVRARDESREMWDGPQLGVCEEVRDYIGVDYVRDVAEFPKVLEQTLANVKSFHYDGSVNPGITHMLSRLDASLQKTLIEKWKDQPPPKNVVVSQRLLKSDSELALMRKSCQVISNALEDAMANCHPKLSLSERLIESYIEHGCKKRGASRMAFPCVVASGNNGTILHYMKNDAIPHPQDFVMVDAGCVVGGYCSDVSRSWPISGKFTAAQKDLYQILVDVQESCISHAYESAILNGTVVSLDVLHVHAARMLTDALLSLGFMKGHSLASALSSGAYARYFPHATGHYLGLDVHDTHSVQKSMALQKGMVITIEPGLYCPPWDTSIPEHFRGLGMRLEDVIAVDHNSADVLSTARKTVSELEALIGSA